MQKKRQNSSMRKISQDPCTDGIGLAQTPFWSEDEGVKVEWKSYVIDEVPTMNDTHSNTVFRGEKSSSCYGLFNLVTSNYLSIFTQSAPTHAATVQTTP